MQNIVKTLLRSGIAALFLLFSSTAFLMEASLPLAAQANHAAAGNQSLSVPEFGVTMQIPPGWSHHQFANVHELLNVPPGKLATLTPLERDQAARISMSQISRSSHSEAVKRLQQITGESKTQATFLVIAGWPALQRQTLVPRPVALEGEDAGPDRMLIQVTTAVAVGNSVFRIDGFIPAELPTANALANQATQAGQALRFQKAGNAAAATQDVQMLQTGPGSGTSSSPAPGTSAPTTLAGTGEAGLASNLTMVNGEPEIAVSTSGKNIVIASQTQFVSSQDGGQTFSGPTTFANSTGGDSSVAFGRSGNFYEGTIGTTNAAVDTQIVNISTDGGKTFPTAKNVFVCGTGGTNPTCRFVGTTTPNGVPDQEHIAADRFNAGSTGGDQVYFVWRSTGGYALSCSQDSGKTWTAPIFKGDGSPDFARIAVGQDGLVYLVYLNGNNIELDRYTSCTNGLTQQNQGAVVAGTTAVTCGGNPGGVPGLDRCNKGNDLRSPSVTVDDTNASHIYVAYATNTLNDSNGNGVNEDVLVHDSFDNGDNFTGSAQVNNSIPGRRYLPWVCSVGGTAYVSWYDRRNASATTNDLSDYFAGSAAPGGAFGFLTAGPDFQINAPGTSDPQCASGWPAATGNQSDSESCFVQPQLAGRCGTASPLAKNDSGTPCDFTGTDATACPNGTNGQESCQIGRGQPKYGDYNGNACAAGRLYSIWSSATSQPNANPTAGIDVFFAEKLVCCSSQIQVSAPAPVTACAGTSASTTLNICNTGKADLQVDAISSSNTQVTVTKPSSGFPLIISPDACLPVGINFSPTGNGTTSSTLTISSNDTVNPSTKVTVSSNAPPPSINATIVNSGNFGNVCPAGQSNLELQITNQSQCDLVVSNITSDSTNFLPPTTAKLPLTLTADATVDLPISFQPSASQSCSNTTPLTGNITVVSNDPTAAGVLVTSVQGTVPCPSINATIANSGSFGNVCSGAQADLNLHVINQGLCNLNITNLVSSSGANFTLPTVTNALPLVLSADAAVNLPIRFQPVAYGSAGYITCSNTVPQTSNITIVSNDPAASNLVQPVNGIEGCPKLVLSPQQLNGIYAFPPTVSDPAQTLGCFTDRQITMANAGICPLIVPSGGLSAGPANYFSVVNPTTPLTVGVGAAPVPVTVRFRPLSTAGQLSNAPDQQLGTLSITSNDPVAGDNTAGGTGGLCGEPTFHSGARILVLNTANNPVNPVASMTLQSKGLTPVFKQTLAPAPLLTAPNICGNTVLYQLDNETLRPAGTTGNSPNASYVLTAKNGPTQANMSFTLGQCEMKQIILQEK